MKWNNLIANLTQCFAKALEKNQSYLKVLISHNPNAQHSINRLFQDLVPLYRKILHVEKEKEVDGGLTFYIASFGSYELE